MWVYSTDSSIEYTHIILKNIFSTYFSNATLSLDAPKSESYNLV